MTLKVLMRVKSETIAEEKVEEMKTETECYELDDELRSERYMRLMFF